MINRIPRSKLSGGLPVTANLELHLMADDVSGSDGDYVTAWTDNSSNGNDASQSTSGWQPVLKTGANGINGHNVVRFDGSDDKMEIADDDSLDMASNYCWYVVGKYISNTSGSDPIFGKTATNETGDDPMYAFQRGPNVASQWTALYTGGSWTDYNADYDLNDGEAYILSGFYDGSNVTNTVNVTVSKSHAETGTVGTSTGRFYLGTDIRWGEYANIDIAEIILYSGTQTEPQKTQIYDYLKEKYGISAIEGIQCSGSDSTYTNGTYYTGSTYDYEKTNDWMETDYAVYNSGTWEIWAFDDVSSWMIIKMWTSTDGDADNIPTTGWTAVAGTGYTTPPTVAVL